MTVKISLWLRILLAVVSAIGVALTLHFDNEIEMLPMGSLLFYSLSGLFFAAGVLFPYIRQDRLCHTRAAALVLASIVSYFAAVQVSIDLPFSAIFGLRSLSLTSFIAGSITGVIIVMVPLVVVAPLRFSRPYCVLGLVAAVAGGMLAYYTLNRDELWIIASGYTGWHVLVCLAIYFGSLRTRDDYQAIP
jgi:hypothetical protein